MFVTPPQGLALNNAKDAPVADRSSDAFHVATSDGDCGFGSHK